MGDMTQVPVEKPLTPEQIEINRLRVRVNELERRFEVLVGLFPEAIKLLRPDPKQPWFE